MNTMVFYNHNNNTITFLYDYIYSIVLSESDKLLIKHILYCKPYTIIKLSDNTVIRVGNVKLAFFFFNNKIISMNFFDVKSLIDMLGV